MEVGDTQTLASHRANAEQPQRDSSERTAQAPACATWSTAHKIGFRFAFCYLALYLYPFSSTLGWYWSMWLPWGTHETPWSQMVPWVSTHVLHWGHPVSMGFLPDSPYQYVKLLCRVLIAVLAVLVWSLLDRKSTAYPKLNQWIHWWVRIALGLTMVAFGAYKIFPMQAPFPDLVTLMQPYGDIGSSRFFWNFLGVSGGYQTFAAIFETSAGLMLLVPGMTTVGALMSFGAMVAVFTQSKFYGVPDALVQLHLILFALFLLVPDVPRLMNLLVLNRGTQPESRKPLVPQRWLNASLWGIQWAAAAYIIVHMVTWGWTTSNEVKRLPVEIPFYGIWNVDEFTADGQVRPPLLTEGSRWQQVIFDGVPAQPSKGLSRKMLAAIQEMNGQFLTYVASVDTKNGVLSLNAPSSADLNGLTRIYIHTAFPENENAQLHYSRPSPDTVVLQGDLDGHRLHVTLRKEEREFALRDIKFHWVIGDKDIHY